MNPKIGDDSWYYVGPAGVVRAYLIYAAGKTLDEQRRATGLSIRTLSRIRSGRRRRYSQSTISALWATLAKGGKDRLLDKWRKDRLLDKTW